MSTGSISYEVGSMLPAIFLSLGLSFSAYPQPASNQINLLINVLDEENLVNILIYNIKGEIIKSIRTNPLKKEVQLDATSLGDGLYMVQLNQADQIYLGKIIIQK